MSLLPSISLSNRVAIVTGGSRGIGKGISLELARRGANVAITYTDAHKSDIVQATIDELKNLGSGATAISIKADIKDPASYETIVQETLKGFSTEKIDILVHNAALMHIGSTPSITQELFSDIIDTNLRGPYFLTQAALPYIPSGGRIILISSTSARLVGVGSPTSVYTASKAALEGLARAWAYEFGPRGITVNAVAPGLTETESLLAMESDTLETIRNNYASITPFGRSGTPDDVAQIVAFLASEGSRWVTGSTVTASGGRVLL